MDENDERGGQTAVARESTPHRRRRRITRALLIAGAILVTGLLIGLTNPWKLVVIDKWLNHAIVGGLLFTGIIVWLCWMHLPRGAIRGGVSALVVLAYGVWALSWFGGFKNQPAHDPLAQQRSPYNDVIAVVDHGGFLFDGIYIYLETDRGLASQRNYVLQAGPRCPRLPHLAFTGPDTLRVTADDGADYSVTFDPETLQVRSTNTANPGTTCSR